MSQGFVGFELVVPDDQFDLPSIKTSLFTEIFKSKAILVGSPPVNKGILSSVDAILEDNCIRFGNDFALSLK